MPPSTFTVQIRNEALQNGRWVGTYATQEEAQGRADHEAAKARNFMTYTVCHGTPEHPGAVIMGTTRRGLK